jgi:hypothetical protein
MHRAPRIELEVFDDARETERAACAALPYAAIGEEAAPAEAASFMRREKDGEPTRDLFGRTVVDARQQQRFEPRRDTRRILGDEWWSENEKADRGVRGPSQERGNTAIRRRTLLRERIQLSVASNRSSINWSVSTCSSVTGGASRSAPFVSSCRG